MEQPIAIFGAGGFAREVLQVVLDVNEHEARERPWQPVGFLVDPEFVSARSVHGLPVLGSLRWLQDNPHVAVIIAVGSPAARRRVCRLIEASCPNPFARLIHPRAWVGRHVEIGPGSVVCAGALLTTDIRIGRHVHINIGGTVGHDATLGDFVTLNPSVNVSGNVHLGEGVEVGTGSVLIPRVDVGCWSIVGAGSVVTKPLPENVTAVGAPAKPIRVREPGWQDEVPR